MTNRDEVRKHSAQNIWITPEELPLQQHLQEAALRSHSLYLQKTFKAYQQTTSFSLHKGDYFFYIKFYTHLLLVPTAASSFSPCYFSDFAGCSDLCVARELVWHAWWAGWPAPAGLSSPAPPLLTFSAGWLVLLSAFLSPLSELPPRPRGPVSEFQCCFLRSFREEKAIWLNQRSWENIRLNICSTMLYTSSVFLFPSHCPQSACS